ncbi:MAG: hypothetical protein OWT28_02985 [Firmicutes bacterium]|nr:hypothetical protein [Bacillota bacterium]
MKKESSGSLVLMIIPAIIMFFCCGLPVLLAGAGLTAIGAFFVGAKDWLIGGVILILGIVFIIRSLRKKESNCQDDCCSPKNLTERK